MSPVAIFRRSDGHEFEAHEGSESFKLMSKDGAFERIDQSGDAADATAGEPEAKPLSKMNRAELAAEAEKRGLSITDDQKKAQIIAAIEEADARQTETDDESNS